MNDNELIYLAKTENLGTARTMLNDKYLNYVNNFQRKLMCPTKSRRETFNDNLSNAYFVFDKCLKSFDIKRTNINFGQMLTLTCKSNYKNEMRKLATTSKLIDRKCITWESIFDTTLKRNQPDDDIQDKLINDCKLKLISEYLRTKPKIVSKLVNLKLQCSRWEEICKQLRYGKKYLQNMWFHFIKSFRRKYKDEIDKLIN